MTFDPIPGVRIVGIGHKARHGKSSVARRIAEQRPNTLVVELSDHVATISRVLHGMDTRDRATLIRVGNGYREIYGPDVWLRCAYGCIADHRPALVLIPNIRFRNEAAFVHALGGDLVKVQRFNEDGSPFVHVAPGFDPTHVLETDLDTYAGWTHVIENRGDLADLHKAADALLD